ncbi:MAG TPA: hypothetical protein ENI33_06210 [Thermoplasmatales archaeon]|nr:hypothetical protein [Thermoplasmatales archaeon]
MKLLSFALVIISIVLPWWKLKGGNSMISTSTKVLLIPPKIVTLTSSPYVVGGEIGSVPLEVTLVLNLISFLLIIICLLIVISLLVKNKSRKTAIASSILSSLLLFVAICLFFYTMSQITKIGIGSFTGRGELEIALPGGGSELLFCKWGAGAGFYLSIMAFLCIISASIYGDINMACPTLKKFFKNLSSLFRKIFDRVKLFKANKKWIRAKLT